MINKEKKMNKNGDVQPTTVNLLCEGTSIKGDVESSNDIRIDGYLNGTLKANGKVVIGGTGKVEGDIVCKTIDVSGTIQGNINISELVTLKATALILGNIATDKIAVEPGARFTGSCKMGAVVQKDHEKKNEPKREKIN